MTYICSSRRWPLKTLNAIIYKQQSLFLCTLKGLVYDCGMFYFFECCLELESLCHTLPIILMSLFQVLDILAFGYSSKEAFIDKREETYFDTIVSLLGLCLTPEFNSQTFNFFLLIFNPVFLTMNSFKHYCYISCFFFWRKWCKQVFRPFETLLVLCSLNEAIPLFLTLFFLNEGG